MSINPNKKGVEDRKGMTQRLANARNPKKKWQKRGESMRNYWMSINPNKGAGGQGEDDTTLTAPPI